MIKWIHVFFNYLNISKTKKVMTLFRNLFPITFSKSKEIHIESCDFTHTHTHIYIYIYISISSWCPKTVGADYSCIGYTEYILPKKKNPHVAQIKEPAWYVRTPVRVTAGAGMMFNDPKSAMIAGHD